MASPTVRLSRQLTPLYPDRQIPSVLSYLDGDEFHGGEAKAQLVRNPANTVAYFRDFLGKKYPALLPPAHARVRC